MLLGFYVYCAMAHSFLGGLISFSIHVETYLTEVSSLQLLAPVDYSLPDLLTKVKVERLYCLQKSISFA